MVEDKLLKSPGLVRRSIFFSEVEAKRAMLGLKIRKSVKKDHLERDHSNLMSNNFLQNEKIMYKKRLFI